MSPALRNKYSNDSLSYYIINYVLLRQKRKRQFPNFSQMKKKLILTTNWQVFIVHPLFDTRYVSMKVFSQVPNSKLGNAIEPHTCSSWKQTKNKENTTVMNKDATGSTLIPLSKLMPHSQSWRCHKSIKRNKTTLTQKLLSYKSNGWSGKMYYFKDLCNKIYTKH